MGYLYRVFRATEEENRRAIIATLDRRAGARLLDLGTHRGEFTMRVAERLGAASVHGVELLEEHAEVARSRGIEVCRADLDEGLPFEDGAFDVVHANQVIEHVKRLDHFVGEIRRVLVAGGLALVCTENLASWHNVAALALGYQPFSLTNVSAVRPIGNRFALHAGEKPTHESWQHVHVLTFAGLRDIFNAHGLEVEDSWGTGYYPLTQRLAGPMAARDPRHAHFIAVVARAPRALRRQRTAATAVGLRSR